MNQPITKEELAWLVIRCTGVAFVWFAFSKLAGFIFAAYLLTSRGLRELQDSLSSAISWNMAWPQAFWFLVYSALAYYLLVRGDRVHRLVCFQPANRSPRSAEEKKPENRVGDGF